MLLVLAICGIESVFLTNIGYLARVTSIDVVGWATVTKTPCTPSVTIIRNCIIGPPWICMPLLFHVVGFGNVIFFAPCTNFIILKGASLVWLRAGWLVIIFIFSSVKWHGLVSQRILPFEIIFCTSPCLVVLHKFL